MEWGPICVPATGARWAPVIVNPVDINGQCIVSRFDVRDYWGYNKGVGQLHFGGSDDDLAFGSGEQDAYRNPVDSSVQAERYDFDDEVSLDPELSLRIWDRVTRGNAEGAVATGTSLPSSRTSLASFATACSRTTTS